LEDSTHRIFASARRQLRPKRIEGTFSDDVRCAVIGLDDIITNKHAAARPQDLADATALERIRIARAKKKG
jgi:hypothetical protein